MQVIGLHFVCHIWHKREEIYILLSQHSDDVWVVDVGLKIVTCEENRLSRIVRMIACVHSYHFDEPFDHFDIYGPIEKPLFGVECARVVTLILTNPLFRNFSAFNPLNEEGDAENASIRAGERNLRDMTV